MHARVSIVSGTPDRADAAIADFRDNAFPGIKELGARGAILLVDRQTGKGMAITLWEDEAAMRASEEGAAELRRSASEQMGGGGEAQVERYEVALLEV